VVAEPLTVADEQGWILDDDSPPGGKGNRSDHRHGYRNQQRARRRNHENRQETLYLAAQGPRENRDAQGQRRVPRA